jgi:DHA1 family bicyclomycin/chloramphenicol resistance-like MFS transporter
MGPTAFRAGRRKQTVKLRPDSLFYTFILAALSAIPPMSIDMTLPAIPAMENAFPQALHRGAWTLSVFLVGFALSPLFAGALADRYGRRPVLLWGLSLLTLAAGACALAQGFALLLLFRLVQGLAAGVCVVMPMAIIRDLFEGPTARLKLAQTVAVLGLAPIVAPMLGSWVLQAGDWRMILWLQAIAGLLLLIMTAVGLHETLGPEHRQPLTVTSLVSAYRTVLLNAQFRNFTLAFAFGFACIFTYISSSSAVLMGELGLSASSFSLVFGATALGLVLGSIIGGKLSQRGTTAPALIRFGLGGMIALALALAMANVAGEAHVWVMMPAVALVLGAFGLAGPNLVHEAMAPVPKFAGAASGISRGAQMGMGALASALVAIATPWGHPVASMGLLMVAFSGMAGAIALLQLRKPQVDGPSPQGAA